MISNHLGRRCQASGAGLAFLLLAQAAGAPSYNLGVPLVPGTRTPESNPATVVTPPPAYATPPPPSPSATGSTTGTPTTMTPAPTSGPAYSFGAAPPPIGATGSGR